MHAEEGEEEAVMSSITYERKAKGRMRMVAKIAEVLEGAEIRLRALAPLSNSLKIYRVH